jgi:hypothetical protein
MRQEQHPGKYRRKLFISPAPSTAPPWGKPLPRHTCLGHRFKVVNAVVEGHCPQVRQPIVVRQGKQGGSGIRQACMHVRTGIEAGGVPMLG